MPRYIDADAFLLAEIERCGSQPVVGTCTMDNEYLSIRIAAAPTISPDEVRGVASWIPHGDCGVTECSACKWSIEEYVEYNYCPNCGARMEVTSDA